MTSEAIGHLLRARRADLKLDQRGLAELAAVSVHTLSDLESGKGNPTLAVLSRLLDVLGLELSIGPRVSP